MDFRGLVGRKATATHSPKSGNGAGSRSLRAWTVHLTIGRGFRYDRGQQRASLLGAMTPTLKLVGKCIKPAACCTVDVFLH